MADNKATMGSVFEQIQGFDLTDIEFDKIGSWPTLGKVAFCGLIVLVLALVSYFFLIDGERASLERLESQEQQLKRDFENKAFRVANLSEYKAQMVEMENSFGSLLKQLPKDTEVPGLIDDISATALNAGLDLKKIDPSDMVSSEFYKELPINIEVSGGYHEMGAFVSGVASLPRIVTLHDFSISKGERQEQLSMKILAKTYQYDAESKGR